MARGGTAIRIEVRSGAGDHTRGLLIAGGWRLPCMLGRGGVTHFKREGDRSTPAARLHPRTVLYRPDRVHRPLVALPVQALAPNDGWCDDPADRNYNRPVRLPYPARHEKLWRRDHLYDLVVVLDWNMQPAIKGRGSAIFLHLTGPGKNPTEGCIAVPPAAIGRLLALLGPDTRIEVG